MVSFLIAVAISVAMAIASILTHFADGTSGAVWATFPWGKMITAWTVALLLAGGAVMVVHVAKLPLVGDKVDVEAKAARWAWWSEHVFLPVLGAYAALEIAEKILEEWFDFPIRVSFIDSSRFASAAVSIVLGAFLIAHLARSAYEGKSILTLLGVIVGIALALSSVVRAERDWFATMKDAPIGTPYLDPATGKWRRWGIPEPMPLTRPFSCPDGRSIC
jgi:hypothetical protein